jgi:hypothetical protein
MSRSQESLPHRKTRARNAWRRCGVVLIVVLVCFALAAAYFLLVVQQSVGERKTIDASFSSLQAAWLAEAGVERAAARLAADAKYAGETWPIAASELAGEAAGKDNAADAVVRIRVAAVEGKPNRRTVTVEADYPTDDVRRSRQTKQIIIDRESLAAESAKGKRSQTK